MCMCICVCQQYEYHFRCYLFVIGPTNPNDKYTGTRLRLVSENLYDSAATIEWRADGGIHKVCHVIKLSLTLCSLMTFFVVCKGSVCYVRVIKYIQIAVGAHWQQDRKVMYALHSCSVTKIDQVPVVPMSTSAADLDSSSASWKILTLNA